MGSLKYPIYSAEGVREKPIYRGELPKKEGFRTVCRFKERVWQKEVGGGGVFEWGVDIPMNTMNLTIILTMILIY